MKIPKFIRTYRFEITMIILAAVGFILLVGDDKNNAVRGVIDRVSTGVGSLVVRLWEGLQSHLLRLTTADYVGLGILAFVVVLVYRRTRWRVATAPKLNTHLCPKCGSKLHRAHRKVLDRVISRVLFLSLRRYKCVNSDCGWNGLVTAESRKSKPDIGE